MSPVTTADALRHAITCLPFREAVALVDAALGRALVDRTDLDAVRPVREVLRFDRVVAASDGRSGSMPETFVRLALRSLGLAVEVQPVVEGVGRLDLLVDRRLVVEVDGYAYHSDRAAFREDRRRDRAAQRIDLRTVRFTYGEAVYRTLDCVHEVAVLVDRLRRAGVPPLREALFRPTGFI